MWQAVLFRVRVTALPRAPQARVPAGVQQERQSAGRAAEYPARALRFVLRWMPVQAQAHGQDWPARRLSRSL